MKEPSRSTYRWGQTWLIYSIAYLIFLLVELVRFSDAHRFSEGLVGVGASAAIAISLLALYRSDLALWKAQFQEDRLGTLIDSLPFPMRTVYANLAASRVQAEDAESCPHTDEREFISEAGLWRCMGCGRAITGGRR